MSEAEIDGKTASLEAAVERSAEILSKARLPVIAGLGTDIAGARGAIALAERLGGAYDHMYSTQVFADLDVMRQAGIMITTPSEARHRADVFLFVGSGLSGIWPQMMERLAPGDVPLFDLAKEKRRIFWISPVPGVTEVAGLPVEAIETADLHATLAALRARAAGRPVSLDAPQGEKIKAAAEALLKARFGVAVWGGEALDRLAVEMLQGLVIDLNKTTRFSGLPLGANANAAGIVQASGWMTGFPMRTAFGRGYPEHDTWRFEAARMVESGEADAALWISAYGPETPGWKRSVPLIALVAPQTQFAEAPQVRIGIGCPGVDHDSAEFFRETGAIIARPASQPSNAPSAAAIVRLIAQQIGGAL